MLNDYIVSHIRTYVPVLVGMAATALAGWLHDRYGILVNVDTAPLAVAATGIATGVYYGLVRLLERRWPKLGRLLGAATQPTYPRG